MATSSSSAAAPAPAHQYWIGPSREFGDRMNRGGLRSVILRQPGGYSAEILFYGAQVVSWKNERGEELLFLSNKAKYKRYDQIRGGIPIYFPGFSDDAKIEQHGFARIRFWSLDTSVDSATSTDKSSVDLILKPTDCDLRNWNNKFEFRLRVTLEHNGDLTMTSRIKNVNTNEEPFSFQFSYHNYFSVSDISEIRIEGLETMDYLDYTRNRERLSEGGEAFTFDSEVDRVYLDTPTMIAVMDHTRIRTYTIRKDASLPDIVVWNPWDKKAKKMDDLDNTEYKKMVCVEAAAVENAITLSPGDEWTGTQRLSVEVSTYSDALPQPGILL